MFSCIVIKLNVISNHDIDHDVCYDIEPYTALDFLENLRNELGDGRVTVAAKATAETVKIRRKL